MMRLLVPHYFIILLDCVVSFGLWDYFVHIKLLIKFVNFLWDHIFFTQSLLGYSS